jgi:hypothetical protein
MGWVGRRSKRPRSRQNRVIHSLITAASAWLFLAPVGQARAQTLEGFNWVDLRTNPDTVALVNKALGKQTYTAVREIGFVGVMPKEDPPTNTVAPSASAMTSDTVGDAAPATSQALPPPPLPLPKDAHLLVVTAERTDPAALPEDDSFAVYDVRQDAGQNGGVATLLLAGPTLKFAGWLRMRRDGDPELVASYRDCVACQSTTFLTTFYLDGKTKDWHARWPRSKAGAPMFSEGQEANGGQQVYALLDDETGRAMLGTFQHFSGRKRRDSDFAFEYLVDNYSGQEVTQPVGGADARALATRLCKGQGVVLGIAGGQSSEICRSGLHSASGASAAHTSRGKHN